MPSSFASIYSAAAIDAIGISIMVARSTGKWSVPTVSADGGFCFGSALFDLLVLTYVKAVLIAAAHARIHRAEHNSEHNNCGDDDEKRILTSPLLGDGAAASSGAGNTGNAGVIIGASMVSSDDSDGSDDSDDSDGSSDDADRPGGDDGDHPHTSTPLGPDRSRGRGRGRGGGAAVNTRAARMARKAVASAATVSFWVLAMFIAAKLLTRLVAGVCPGPSSNASGSAQVRFFWGVVAWAAVCSVAELILLKRALRRSAAAVARSGAGAQVRPQKKKAGVRDILALCAPDWPLFLLALLGLCVAAAGESAIPFLFGRIIDAIALEQDTATFHRYMAYLVGVAAVTGIFTGLRGSTFIIVGARFSARLRQRLFDSLLRQEVAFFDKTKTGDVTSRLTADCQKVADNVELNVNVFLRSLLQVAFTLSFMMYISYRLALVAFVSVPLVVGASKRFGAYMRTLSKRTQRETARTNAVAGECFAEIETVKMFAAEVEESARFARAVKRLYRCTHDYASAYAAFAASTYTFLPYCTSCLVLYYGGKLHDQGQLQGGDLVSFVFYMQSLFSAFSSLGAIYTGLVQAVGAADKVFQWIWRQPKDGVASNDDGNKHSNSGSGGDDVAGDKQTDVAEASVELSEREVESASAVEPDNLRPAICRGDVQLRDVTFRYPSRPEHVVLRGLSLHARAGEVLALCGPSGGGKSSCVALLERFYSPERGRVMLDGIDVHKLCPRWLHRQVAMVGQEPVLFARTIRENILLGLLDEDCLAGGGGGGGGGSGDGSVGVRTPSPVAPAMASASAFGVADGAEARQPTLDEPERGSAALMDSCAFGDNADFDPWCCSGRRQSKWHRLRQQRKRKRRERRKQPHSSAAEAAEAGTTANLEQYTVPKGLDCPRSHFRYGGWDEATCNARVIEAAKLANAHEFIMSFEKGYETQVGERGAQLSGGQKQRIAIARALVRRPRVLLLDEATSALDADSEHSVQQAIDGLIAQGGMTVIVIAHRLSTIKHAHNIVVVQKGQLVEQGKHNELVASGGVYKSLVMRQLQKSKEEVEAAEAASIEQ